MSTLAHWIVPPGHPAFAGHFPGMPILPGVVLLDWALQVICDTSGIVLQSCTINSVKFLHPALPGDALILAHSQLENGSILFDISTATHKIASGSVVINLKNDSSR